MAEEMQKIYCCPNNNSPMEMAALMNNNGWNNNPFIWLVFLAWMNGGYGFGNRGDMAQNADLSRQLQTLQGTVADNHNNDLALQAINGNRDAMGQLAQTFNTDITAIQTAICGVKSAIEQVSGQVGYSSESVKNAISMGDANIVSKMQECCCANKLLVQHMGYEGQLRDQSNTAALTSRIDQLSNGIQQGFAQVGYATAQQTCDIITAVNAAQQRTSDLLQGHWTAELSQALQDEKFKNSQLTQTQQLLNAINGGCQCNS